MKKYHKVHVNPPFGERRTKTRFLVFPKRIDMETRWLETATWEEEYLMFRYIDDCCIPGYRSQWVATNWI